MQRDLDGLASRTFDAVVVGGGIYGLTIAYDCAQRGLSVALIERHDFGSGASFNHLRTIHGGLRYLQTLDVSRARESVAERRTVARIAPEAVRPLRFVLPLSRHSLMQGPLAMRAGFILDGILSRHRNDGVPESLQLPAGRVMSSVEALNGVQDAKTAHATEAATWFDYVTTDADRLTLSWGLAAAQHGALIANYVDATALMLEGGRAIGVQASDQRSNRAFTIAARLIVNATGGAVDRLLGASGLQSATPMLMAMNLVTRRAAPDIAIGGRGPNGRTLFMVPYKGRALYGTWESPRPCAPDAAPRRDEVETFLDEINHAFPVARLTLADVSLVHRGIVPAVVRADGRASLEGHERVTDHADRGIEGLLTVAGTKYTTARAVAERVTNRILTKLGRSPVACRTGETPLPFTDGAPEALLRKAAREEMVMTLEDAVVRRTSLGALGQPDDDVMEHAAGIVGETLGWDAARRRGEIDALKAFYGTSNAWMT